MNNNKRIAQNTIYMYIRMGITMLVQLYTSRVVLANLGVEDYGIYNVVGSFIVAFTFISGPLGTATQRFLNFELGRKDDCRVNLIFNLSLYIYVVLGILLFIIIECVGEWFLYNKMQLPTGRLVATQWAFQLSVIALIFSLVKMPFESMIVAYERMSYYAYVSIAEVVLKLLNAASLAFFTCDKLKLYAVNQLIITIIIFGSLQWFCHKNFFQQVRIRRVWDKKMFLSMLNFSGWSLFGSMASMSANQGLNILLNLFFGVVVNAAMGIATQINAAINQFVSNFQIAFRPQIVKYYAASEIDMLRRLITNTSKYSYILLLGLVCPIVMNIDLILRLWLKTPPEYTSEFTIFMLVYALLETLSAPMWMTVQATGKIRNYQLIISTLISMNIGISYIFLKMGYPPSVVLIIKCFMDLLYLAVRLWFMHIKIQFSVRRYATEVLFRLCCVTFACVTAIMALYYVISNEMLRFTFGNLIFILFYGILVYFVALNGNERKKMIGFARSKLSRYMNDEKK